MKNHNHYTQIAQNWQSAAVLQRKAGVFYCEYKEDNSFWTKVLNVYSPDLIFESKWRTNTIRGDMVTSGKGQVFNFLHCANPSFLLFVDSDYDFLLDDIRLNNNFLAHTFTYSIENHWCYAPSIKPFLEQKYNVCIDFDFELFLEKFSKIIYNAFIYTVLNRKKQVNYFSTSELEKLLSFQNFSIDDNANSYLIHIENVLEAEVAKLKTLFLQDDFNNLELHLQTQKGLIAKTTYLYLRGHTLYEKVLKNILRVIKNDSLEKGFAILADQEKEFFRKRTKSFTNLSPNLSFSGYSQMESIFKLMAQKGFRKV